MSIKLNKKLILLSGSTRKESLNKKLVRAAAGTAKQLGATPEIVELSDYDLPIYNGDYEEEHSLPDSAISLKSLFEKADGFLISSPEYNGSIPPVLINALHWMSRAKTKDEAPMIAFQGKVAALIAASPGGMGGLRGLVPLRMLLGNLGVTVIPGQLAVGGAHDKFDDKGVLTDEHTAKSLERVVASLINTNVVS